MRERKSSRIHVYLRCSSPRSAESIEGQLACVIKAAAARWGTCARPHGPTARPRRSRRRRKKG
jgi:hypothetical protein